MSDIKIALYAWDVHTHDITLRVQSFYIIVAYATDMCDFDQDPHCSIVHRLGFLHRCLRQYVSEDLKDLGIGPGHFLLLNALFSNDGITQEDFSQMLHIDKATTARTAKKLEALGYLAREVDLLDRRAYRLHLTKKGTDIKPRLDQTLEKATEVITQNLTENEKQTLRQLLGKMVSTPLPTMYRQVKRPK